MSDDLTISQLHNDFDKLQAKWGEPSLDPIYGAGQTNSPKTCFVFMNPTARNISSQKSWQGLKAPWIGTKNIWKLFLKIGLFPESLFEEIEKRSSSDWDEEFAYVVYKTIEEKDLFITNLAKCTQLDARPLSDSVYREYLDLFEKEISILNPKAVVTFGNQVSSIFLQEPISVSKVREKEFKRDIGEGIYKTYPVFYPVGQGMRNMDKAVEDLKAILSL
jgi:hypothetical protein